jgi:deoxyribonuclease V
MIRGRNDPGWTAVVEEWKRQQEDLRRRIAVRPLAPLPRFVAGADAAYSRDKQTIHAAAVVYDRQEQRIVEVAHARRPVEFPYIPGFLAFREGPAVLEALGRLTHPFGAVCFDGAGYAHPRRCGLATFLGIPLDLPSVGVAKSRLVGAFEEPGIETGDGSPLMDGDEQVGLVLRTRRNVRPLFISIGHNVDLPSARALVLACCTRCRVPEPTRQADIEVGKISKH